MKKYLLFLIVFIASGILTGSIGGKSSLSTFERELLSSPSTTMSDGFLKMQPQNVPGEIIEIPDNIINENLVEKNKEVTCMAKNIFFEAAVESTAGKLAVAHVTLNRVSSRNFPNSVCEVVYDGLHYTGAGGKQFPVRDRCQFSWYCDGKGDEPREGKLWLKAQELAKYVLLRQEELPDITDGALHYHADYIDAPTWTARKKVTTKIDTHIFYRTNTWHL